MMATRLRRLVAGFEAEPDGVLVAILCLFGGSSALLGPRPGSIQETLPGWLQLAWAVVLVAGGAIRLVGLLLERVDLDGAGCMLIGGGALLFGLVVMARSPAGWAGGALILTTAAAALQRCRRYWTDYHPRRPARGRP